MKRRILLLAAITLWNTGLRANVMNYDTSVQYATIQAAITAATSGQRLLITTGTFTEAISIYNKNLTLLGQYQHGFGLQLTNDTIIKPAPGSYTVVTISNAAVRLADLHITGGNPPASMSLRGGGLDISGDCSVTMRNCSVYGNLARGNGGGLYVGDSTLALIDTDIYNNTAEVAGVLGGNGGALYALSSHLVISNCHLSACRAERSGGGIRMLQSSVELDSTSTLSDHTAHEGAGLSLDNESRCYCNASIYGNQAGQRGGGLLLESNSTGVLAGAVIYLNIAENGDGGGLYADHSTVECRGSELNAFCMLYGNTAASNGGALCLANESQLRSSAGSFGSVMGGASNIAWNCGGGIFAADSSLWMTNSYFLYNCASNAGGGLFATNCAVTLSAGSVGIETNGVCYGNYAGNGGGLCLMNSTLAMTNVNIAGNRCSGNGGGLYIQFSDVTGQNMIINANQTSMGAGSYGGGLFSWYGDAEFDGLLMCTNSANTGGAIYWYSDHILLAGLTSQAVFSNNFANKDGGAIAVYGVGNGGVRITTTDWSRPHITDNRANGNGGGVYVASGQFHASNLGFSLNRADNNENGAGNGGALWVGSTGSALLDGNTISFYKNDAYCGGGIFITDGQSVTSKVSGGEFYSFGNSARLRGGLLYVDSGCSFSETDWGFNSANRAAEGGAIFANTGAVVTIVQTETNTVEQTLFTSCRATNGNGGAICAVGTNTVINLGNIRIADCQANGMGSAMGMGGAIAIHTNATLYGTNLYLFRNTAQNNGGAIFVDGGVANLDSTGYDPSESVYKDKWMPYTIILENTATNGGALALFDGNITVDKGWIAENTAINGGAVYVFAHGEAVCRLRNTVLLKNAASNALGKGGGINVQNNGEAYLQYCTLYSNQPSNVEATPSAGVGMADCIAWGGSRTNISNDATVMYSVIQGGHAGLANSAADPKLSFPAIDDLRITLFSAPCRGQAMDVGIDHDILGQPRNVTSGFDIGAYQYDANTADSDKDLMYDAWELSYHLDPTNPADSFVDMDDDDFWNFAEFFADTNPTNSADYLKVARLDCDGMNQDIGTNIIQLQSSSNRIYYLEMSRDGGKTYDDSFTAPLVGNGGMLEFRMSTYHYSNKFFRVRAQLP